MGMDSFMAVELRCRLESIVGHAVPPTFAFDHPNIVALARFLLGWSAQPEVPRSPEVFHTAEETHRGAVAIVGASCRFPGGANDPEAFWQILLDRKDTVCVVPPERWPEAEFYDPKPDVAGKSYVRCGNFLNFPIANFDAAFFGITPREAAPMDPQQRLLLELCWEGLEDAGRSPEKMAGSQTGVFVGINANDYSRRLLALAQFSTLDAYTFTGNTFSVAAGRISHFLGLHGPSLAVDTACSSSLVAVHLAVRSLRARECDLALACGVNVMLSPDGHVILSRMHALAPDGRCKAFDASADGYGRGERRRRRRAEAAGRCPKGRRPYPGRDQGIVRKSRRAEQRSDRPQRRGAAVAFERRVVGRRRICGACKLCRGARDRDAARRSD